MLSVKCWFSAPTIKIYSESFTHAPAAAITTKAATIKSPYKVPVREEYNYVRVLVPHSDATDSSKMSLSLAIN